MTFVKSLISLKIAKLKFKIENSDPTKQIEKILYDDTNRIKSFENNYCEFYINKKGAEIEVVTDVKKGTISYSFNDLILCTSEYKINGNEKLYTFQEIEQALGEYGEFKVKGFYLEPDYTTPFTSNDLDYDNVKDFTLYIKADEIL